MNRPIAAAAGAVVVAAIVAAVVVSRREPNEREVKVRGDRDHVATIDSWIYDDLPRGIEEAKKSGKPLLVVFRCIPCEACAKIDEDVVERDPGIAALLDRFVCVRIPHANGMDLSVFQFDYDQSWAAFMMNADLTIYGRYGTRSDRTHSEDDVSLESFAKAMDAALELHAKYPANRRELADKQGVAVAVRRPEDYASLSTFKPALDWDGKVVPSCIHCHMVADAMRRRFRDAGETIPERLLFPYPNPSVVGMVMDPKERARVKSVSPGSPAERAGVRAGDDIAALDGQPILSTADIQWVLQRIDHGGSFDASIFRDGKELPRVHVELEPGWRSGADISWRASSWELRRMLTGGMNLEDVPDDERGKLGVDKASMALRVRFIGEYGEYAVAKNAGCRKDDVVVAFGGRTTRMSETALFAALATATKRGDKVAVTVLRDGKRIEMSIAMQ